MLEETNQTEEIVARVAALDIGKAELVCCIRVPGQGRRSKRLQEVATYQTMTRSLLVLADRLAELGVTRVVMEATSDYWKAPFYLLEAQGFEVWLVNAKDVKHLPGRPKTDKLDAVWLAKLAERGMLRPSFVPPLPIRRLRDLTRYRADLVAVRTAEKQRAEKLLEDAVTAAEPVQHLGLDPPGKRGRVTERLLRCRDGDGMGASQAQAKPLGPLDQQLEVPAAGEQVVDELPPERLLAADGDPPGALVAVGEGRGGVVGGPQYRPCDRAEDAGAARRPGRG